MMRQVAVGGLLCLGVALWAGGEDKKEQAPKAETNAGLELMKKLVGTWVLADENGKPTEQVVSVIKLTAGGSVIHETLFPGQDHEMVSVYVADGPDLVMTHYCMLGNQPQMKAKTKSLAKTLNFEFDGGTNFDPKKDKHMHAAVLTVVDDDHYEVDGVGWEDGKPAKEMCGGMKLIRQK